MRILHVIGWVDFVDGGPPVVATRLAAAQARLGHEVEIAFYSSRDADRRTDAALAGLPGWDRVKVHRFPPCSKLERLLGTSAGRQLKPMIAAADAVHLHNVWEGLLIRAAASARALAKPHLMLLNGMLNPWSLTQRPVKKRLALRFTHRRMLNACTLHLLNQQERELIKPLGLKAPAVVIPNGVTLEEIDPLPPAGEFLSTRPELAGRRFILFLSRLNHQKGLDFLAGAFALLAGAHPAVDLVVAGPEGGSGEDFRARIAAAGLAGRVHIVGPLYGREKFAAMVDCDCFVLPSRHEGFSIAILEAMAAAAAVVISREANFPEIAAAGAGKVCELNAASLAAGIDGVLGDPQRRRMGQAGRALIESRYTWSRVAQRTIQAYQSASASGAGG